jgi:hypothetical protein
LFNFNSGLYGHCTIFLFLDIYGCRSVDVAVAAIDVTGLYGNGPGKKVGQDIIANSSHLNTYWFRTPSLFAIRVTRFACEKNRTKCVHTNSFFVNINTYLLLHNKYPKIWASYVIFKKLAKVNNRPIAGNPPNLVTLFAIVEREKKSIIPSIPL